MPTFDIKMPKLGESITEGTIVSWLVKAGDHVNEDDVIFEVTTAKVNAEVPSPVSGILIKILYSEGDTVPVGNVVAVIQPDGIDEAEASDKTGSLDSTMESPGSDASFQEPLTGPAVKTEKGIKDDRWYSPVVMELAKEAGIGAEELSQVPGTGYLGRLSNKDIKEYIEQKKKGKMPFASKDKLPIEAALSAPPIQNRPVPAPVLVTESADDYSETVNMDPVGRIIADRMIQSKNVSAHVTTVVEADVTRLVKWRDSRKDSFMKQEGVALTFMPAIVNATAMALKEFPKLNASVSDYKFILKKHINVGVAVALDDGNLVVPVVHDADKLNISGLALAIDSLAKKARTNKLTLDDVQGGTFTITNFGTFRNIIGTPIINQPEVAILGVGYIGKKPAVIETPEGDAIAIRHQMYLSLSYDHRIINGAVGGAFLRRIADFLENWDTNS